MGESFGEWVRRERKAKQLDQVELARRAQMDPSTIKRVEAGRPFRQSTAKAIERALDVQAPIALLPAVPPQRPPGPLGEPQPPPLVPGLEPLPGASFRPIPVINWIHAGVWEEAVEAGQVEEWMWISRRGFKRVFGLLVRGDSMEPEFREGDAIAVAPDASVVSGNYIVVIDLRTKECVLKRYRRADGRVVLESLNPAYGPLEVATEDLRVVGKVIASERRF